MVTVSGTSEALRIVHVITKGDVGGAQTHVVELATTQKQLGAAVHVVAGCDGPALERLRENGVATSVVPSLAAAWSGGSKRAAIGDLRIELRGLAPDVVHGHSSHAGLFSRLAARSLGVPSVYTAHGWPFQAGAPWRQRLSSFLGESAGAWVGDAVICLTAAEAERARVVVPRRRLWIVPNGIRDVAVGEVRPIGRSSDGPVRLVMVARFAPPKRQLDLVRALNAVADASWTLTFVGDGPDLDVCRDEAERLFPDGRVRFEGHRDDVPSLLAEHDVAVLWSGYEGMPMALLEGMRAGLCCVANDLPGVRALFDTEARAGDGAEGAGRIVTDGAELAAAVAGWCDDRAELDRLGVAARARYLEAFTASEMVAATARVYAAAIARRRFIGPRRARGA